MRLCNPVASVFRPFLVRKEKVEDAVYRENAIDHTVQNPHHLHTSNVEARVGKEADFDRCDERGEQKAKTHNRVPVGNPPGRARIDDSSAVVLELG